jgi:type I restriction enzyme, S subunit
MRDDFVSLVRDNLDVWTTAVQRKPGAGRGGGGRMAFYGVDRLRTLILDLAIRGKLVAQDPGDEPATKLLERVAKSRGITAGKKRGDKRQAGVRGAESDLPAGWETVQLDELANSQAGFAFRSEGFNEHGLGLPLIRIRDVGQPFTGTFYLGEHREEFVVQKGEYLISMDGEFRVAPWNGDVALLNQRVSRLQFYSDEIEPRFVAIELQTGLSKLQGVKAYTTVDHLSGKQIAETKIAVPPLAEQQRIVAKVDELMTLCDALEADSAAAMAAHQKLVGALLTALTGSTCNADLALNWARLETHFDILFTTEASIDALKRTILELAVRGKIVPQSPNDEPARALLNVIAKEIVAYSAANRIGVAQQGPIDPGILPFDVPVAWAWSRLSGVFKVITDGDHQPPPKSETGVAFLTIGNITTGRLDFEGCRTVPDNYYESLAKYRTPARGDILYTVVGATYGRPAVVDTNRKFCVQRHIAIMKPSAHMDLRFLAFLLASPLVYDQASAGTTGTAQPTVALGPLRNFLVPVPPLAEQRRIVAKIDELMALCDALRVGLGDAAETQKNLADTIIECAAA